MGKRTTDKRNTRWVLTPGQFLVEIAFHIGLGDPEWEAYAINNAPALAVGDLVRFVGLAPSKESLVSARREVGMV